jgi:hypothetical protein
METGQKLMAIANNNLEHTNNKRLSIQISLNGLSFCILEIESQTVTQLYHTHFNERVTPVTLLDIIKNLFKVEVVLQKNFQSVQVIHSNDLSTNIPKELFNENHIADYLKFNSKILKSDFIAFDCVDINDSICVYVPYVNINNFIYEQFGSFTYSHISTILINQILKAEKNSKSTSVYLHIYEGCFQIIVSDNGNLELYNSFEFQSKEDFIYYTLFTLEQLHLDPETLKIKLLGSIEEHDELYTILYKYIRHVEFGKRFDQYKYAYETKTTYADFTLIHSL